MNQFRMAVIALVMILMTGCRSIAEEHAEGKEAVPDNAPVSDAESVPYDTFALEVNYGRGKHSTFEAVYDKQEREEASIKDHLNGADREGEEALNEMKMVLSELSVAKSDSKQDVISNVLEAFNLDERYDRFHLRVKWPDGTSRIYNGK
ncbi:YusW family protein [Bacillus haynesii]|uniref:YusW family protein n=1 Tax=Bacillus haynesii TaxID=1925021 RepID=UPI002281B698|nr:YusW family protein [Bacillus haynesii]MCY8093003.1 YusW family protein [Bacillus haynesii]MCY8294082.1 YusW family protein [Bacillus haynesii]MCY8407798.1 YusW family protein [Bacillus haynesii]MCY8434210.1 YusW family protein [Bacillus haynesii]MCY8625354.1 YusW family protein [Bacillus haynesii]